MKMKSYLAAILSVIAAVILDQYTKFLAVKYLKTKPIPIIDGVFELHYLENRGAAFGLMQNQQIYFLFVAVIMLILCIYAYAKMSFTKRVLPVRICLILIVSGAIGNMIDRIRLNYVVDFLYFKLINFPIFNVADIYVTTATFGIVLLILFFYKEEELDQFFSFFSFKKKDRGI